MGWWRVGADALAASRFVVSPVAETTASLLALQRGSAGYLGAADWLAAHRPAYRQRLADDPVAALSLRAAIGRRWIADFLTPAPSADGEQDLATELASIAATPPDMVRADLEISLGGPLPDELRRPDLALRLADLLEWVWTQTVRPDWPRRQRILHADVLARSARLAQGGWVAALNDLRPGTRWLGDGRLQINAHSLPPRDISAAQLLFVPVTSGRGWVSWDEPHRYALIYPCGGLLAEADHLPVSEPLAALIGPGRAQALILLGTPKSTSQLVALSGLALGSVGRHLKIMLDSGLVQRRRVGRSVIYSRTPAGDTLVAVQPAGRDTAD